MLDKTKVNKILVITLSNIGDCLATLPVIDVLREILPQRQITIMAGPRVKDIFRDCPWLDELIIYDKHSRMREKIKLTSILRKKRFDLVVDLRNTAFPLLIGAKYKTTPFIIMPKDISHMKDRHLYRLKRVIGEIPQNIKYDSFCISKEDGSYIKDTLKEEGVEDAEKLVLIAPGANSALKKWPKENFAKICDLLTQKMKIKAVIAGDQKDKSLAQEITNLTHHKPIDLSGQTTLKQLGALIKRCSLVISNVSGIMHLASYLGAPTLAIFGPSDPDNAYPWNEKSKFIFKKLDCSPCEESNCQFDRQCLTKITPEEVFDAAQKMLADI